MSSVFDRFTDGARRAVVRGRKEARSSGHAHVGTEHLLLGLVGDDGVAGRAFGSMEISLEAARARVVAVVGHGSGVDGDLPFTPRARKVLELSRREASSLGDRSVGTEHLALGLVRVDDSNGVRVMRGLGVEPHDVRERVRELISTRPASRASRGDAPGLPWRLTPQSRQMLDRSVRRVLDLGYARLGNRYPPVRLFRTAERAMRELRSAHPPEITPPPPVDPRVDPSAIAPAACLYCGVTSPDCGALFVGNGATLICEHCVDRLHRE